jgi:hypothetical protein
MSHSYVGWWVFVFFFFFGRIGVGTQLQACKAGSLLLEPHLQSISLWLFWKWVLSNGSGTALIQVARIIGRNHWSLVHTLISAVDKMIFMP